MSTTIEAGGLRVNFELTGDPENPVVVLSHALGTNFRLWNSQVEILSRSFRVLRYDIRGHGGTEVAPGPYAIDMLARDLLALLDGLGIDKAHMAGVSLGGFIAQWLGANARDRVGRLVLANTAAKVGSRDGWNSRIALVREGGMEAIAQASIERWFTPGFISREPAAIETARRALVETTAEGYVGCCAAIRDMDLRELSPRVEASTLVIAGSADQSTTVADAEWLARHMPRARVVVHSAAHLSNVEARDRFNDDVMRFFSSPEE
jgi:3-oxoadipate enol-lactonase